MVVNPIDLARKRDAVPRLFLTPGNPVVLWSPGKGWSRHLRSHADVMAFEMNEEDAFSRAALIKPGMAPHPMHYALFLADDPLHKELRAAVAEPFRQSRIGRWEPLVRHTVSCRIEQVRDLVRRTGRFDLVRDFAQPAALEIISTIIGASTDEMPDYMHHMVEVTEAEKLNRFPSQPGLVADLRRLRERLMGRPDTTRVYGQLIERLQQGRPVGGREHGEDYIDGYAASLLFAGTDTAAMTLANVLILLERHGLWNVAVDAAATGDVAALRCLIEEAMRLLPAFPANGAQTVRPVTLPSGVRLQVGETVIAWLAAANLDPRVFPDPLEFKPARPQTHLTFGWGPHYCLGASLARLETLVMLESVLLLPGLRRVPGTEPVRKLGRINRVVKDLYEFAA